MLVLSRKAHEAVRVRDRNTGAEFTVTVTRIDRNAVRIGFNAAQNFEILRTELIHPLNQNAGPTPQAV